MHLGCLLVALNLQVGKKVERENCVHTSKSGAQSLNPLSYFTVLPQSELHVICQVRRWTWMPCSANLS